MGARSEASLSTTNPVHISSFGILQSVCAQLTNSRASPHVCIRSLFAIGSFLRDQDAAFCAHAFASSVHAGRCCAQDNVGLLVGDGAQRIQHALVTIDITASVLAEASELSSDLVR